MQQFGSDPVESGNRADIVDRSGRRVVEGQHIMQASSDIFLGWSQDDARELCPSIATAFLNFLSPDLVNSTASPLIMPWVAPVTT